MKTVFTAAALAAILAGAATAATVPNGDFSAGNSGFTSGYTYGPNAGDLLNGPPQSGAGYYAVVNDAQFSHPYFTSFGDHTTGKGLYLVGNGATNPGVAVYSSGAIAVAANRSYTFSAFFANAYPASPADMDFRVSLNGGPATSIGDFTIPNGAGTWNAATKTFRTFGATSVVLSFVDRNVAASGNDFGIDDISMNAVPEPATWAMMIAGFALVGLGLRRRSLAVA